MSESFKFDNCEEKYNSIQHAKTIKLKLKSFLRDDILLQAFYIIFVTFIECSYYRS